MTTELKGLIETQMSAFEEFKTANDKKIDEIAKKGYAPLETQDKVAALNTEMSELASKMASVEKYQARQAIMGEMDGKKQRTPEQIEHKAALVDYMRTGNDVGLKALQKKAMNSQTDPDGGYLIEEEMDSAIDRFAQTISAIPRLARQVTIGSNTWETLVKTSGLSMRRVADGASGGETAEPKYSKISIPVYTAEVEPWVNNESLEDAFINLEADLALEAGIGFAEGEAAEYISGNGVGKAMGITSYTNVANASFAWGKVGYIPSGKSAAFTSVAPADAFVALQHSLKAQYRPNAVWLMNDATLGLARQMKDASGSYYLWNPNALGGFGGTFLGTPVEIDDNVAAIGANSYSVAIADFQRAYAVVTRAGTSLIRDNLTSKGVTKFNFRRRFGAGITNFEAIKLMKFATS